MVLLGILKENLRRVRQFKNFEQGFLLKLPSDFNIFKYNLASIGQFKDSGYAFVGHISSLFD